MAEEEDWSGYTRCVAIAMISGQPFAALMLTSICYFGHVRQLCCWLETGLARSWRVKSLHIHAARSFTSEETESHYSYSFGR